jgi:hypothetical protein
VTRDQTFVPLVEQEQSRKSRERLENADVAAHGSPATRSGSSGGRRS